MAWIMLFLEKSIFRMANIVRQTVKIPDQTVPQEQSDQDLYCLPY